MNDIIIGGSSKDWYCVFCTFNNSVDNDFCVVCEKPKKRSRITQQQQQQWTCMQCTLLNDSNCQRCIACGYEHNVAVFVCPICNGCFKSIALLNEHISLHTTTTNSVPSDGSGTSNDKKRILSNDTLGGGSTALTVGNRGGDKEYDPPPSDVAGRTIGIMKELHLYYVNQVGKFRSYKLCPHVDHFQTQPYDKRFGCGYRNIQMMLSYLYTIPHFKDALFHGSRNFPNIPTIQETLEKAWKEGFDQVSARDFNFRLKGQKKWIGTGEIAALLAYFGLSVGIYEFKSIPATESYHYKPNSELAHWVLNYFSMKEDQFLPPLYLQYSGHSCTIVGVEQAKDGTISLLMFDPATSGSHIMECTLLGRPIKCPAHHLVKKEYQIVTVVEPRLLSTTEREKSKILKKPQFNMI